MNEAIFGAFSEEQVERLTGLSIGQLRYWNRIYFIRPEYLDEARGRSFRRIYSFKDLLKLRVLNQLRNKHKIPMSELKKVERDLAHMGDDKWTSQKLWVHGKRVVYEEPDTKKKREISTRQYVAEIPLAIVTSSARADIRRLNARSGEIIGKIEKRRSVHSSEPVFAGTRIPVKAIIAYVNAGYKDKEILRKFPDLRGADIAAAREYAAAKVA